MASVNQAATISTAEGIAKRVHGEIRDMVPAKNLKALNRIKYDSKNVLGGEYAELVYLTGEHGFTYGGSSGAKRTLNTSEVAESQLATGTPSEIDFRSEVTIGLMSRAAQGGEKAFESYVSALMRNSKKAFDKRLEHAVTRGGASIGSINATATDGGTTITFVVSLKTWMPHIWLNSRNMAFDAFNGTTQLNTRAELFVRTVNIATRTIVATGNSDDINDIVAATTNVQFYYRGQRLNDGSGTMMDFTGMRTIANLTTGEYLGIDAAVYTDVWNGTQVTWDSSTTDFSWAVLNDGIEDAMGRGLEGDLIVQVPFPVWNQLNNSLDALRVLDSSYSVQKQEMGHALDAIVYHGLNGKNTIECSGFQPYGEVLCYPDPGDTADHVAVPRRIGSSNVTFEYPGKGGEMFTKVEGTNAVEWYAFTDQFLWAPNPRGFLLFSS